MYLYILSYICLGKKVVNIGDVQKHTENSNLFLNQSKLRYETEGRTRKGDLSSYLIDYQQFFKVYTSSQNSQAIAYLEGIFLTERNKRNIERMSKQNNQHYQKQHHFLSDSP